MNRFEYNFLFILVTAIIHCKHRISSSLDIIIEIKYILNNENLPYKSEDILQSLSKSDKILFHKLFSLD